MERRIRWGIIGAAGITEKMIPAIKRDKNSILMAIASRDLRKAESLAENYKIDLIYDSYCELIKDRQIDAVYIPLINSLHYKWSLISLKNGKNVMCEKPFTTDPEGARKLIQFANEKGLLIREAFMYRFHPQYDFVKNVIARGEIGKLKSIYSVFTFSNNNRNSYLLKQRYGGGSLMDVGCYCVNLFRMLLNDEPESVYAKADMSEVDLSMVGILKFKNGVIATFESSISQFERHLVIIRGERGEIELHNPWIPEEENRIIIKTERGTKIIRIKKQDTYRLQVEDFTQVLLKKRSNKIDLFDPYKNMKVITALKVSVKKGKEIKVV